MLDSPSSQTGGILDSPGSQGGGISTEWPPKTDLTDLFIKLGLDRYTELFQQQEVRRCTIIYLYLCDCVMMVFF